MKDLFAILLLFILCLAVTGMAEGPPGIDEGSLPNYIEIKSGSNIDATLQKYEGKKVGLNGKISDKPWQHLIGSFPEYPHIYYFDIDGGGQTVLYCKEKIDPGTYIMAIGTPVKVTGESKDPRSNKAYTEYQILVDRWDYAGQKEKGVFKK
ncbi:MAG: hypothetical protein V1843_04060 [bacterium]